MVCKDGKVLLGMKKIRFGAGRWNGFGGKVEPGEAIEAAARREVLEESGLAVKDIRKVGVMDFEFTDGTEPRQVHFFVVDRFEGEPKESDEMSPQWFDENKIPFGEMWPNDAYIYPYLLSGQAFRGRFLYDHPSTKEFASTVLEKKIEVVDSDQID